MEFEWDENKCEANLAKHDIDFADVVVVFEDPNKINIIDDRKDYGEIRIRTIGKYFEDLIVAIINTDRNGFIRIISARQANKKERRMYYGNR